MSGSRAVRLPSGRSGGFDGLPDGNRIAATWKTDGLCDTWGNRDCEHRNEHCAGNLVAVHLLDDLTGSTQTLLTCAAHAASRHGVHPSGEPTAAYVAAVTS